MLICEDILLLLTRDDGRTEAWVSYRPYALAGGRLSDLALANCLEFEPTGKNPKVALKGGPVGTPGGFADPAGGAGGEPPPADGPGAIMEFGLRALASRSKPTRVQSVVTAGWFNPQEVVSRSLVAQGIVGLEEKRMLGLRPERYPVLDPQPEAHTRARLADALAGRGPIAPADVMILGILQAIDAPRNVLRAELEQVGLKPREAKKRIAALAEELPADARHGNRAIKGVVDSMNAAIMGAIAATAAGGAAASS